MKIHNLGISHRIRIFDNGQIDLIAINGSIVTEYESLAALRNEIIELATLLAINMEIHKLVDPKNLPLTEILNLGITVGKNNSMNTTKPQEHIS